MILRTILIAVLGATAVYACAGAPSESRYGPMGAFKRSDTASGYSHFLVGRFAALTNDPREAATRYAAAMESLPGDRSLAERAVFAALLADDFDRAVSAARAFPLDIAGEASLARLTLGVDGLRKGDSERAAEILQGSDLGPFNRMVALNLAAWAELDRAGLSAAKTLLLDGRTGDTLLDGVTLNMVGFLQLAAQDDAGALKTFETVWESGARLAVATEAHARLLMAAGERDRALRVLQDFRTEVGPNPGVSHLADEIEANADIALNRPTIRQGAALSIYAPAAALAAQTEGDLAGVYFAMALALDPDLHVARTLWGEALDDAGRRADAIDVLDRVPAGSPFYATAQGQLAWALRREGRNEESIRTASEALKNTSDRDLKVQLGDLMRSLDRHGEAEKIFDQVIASDAAEGRTDWRLLYARGAARERMGDWPRAEADLRAALEHAPDQPTVLNYLGYGLVDRGEKLEEALEMIRKAVRLEPRSGQIVDSLGWAYYRLGRFDEAVNYLERAVELDPGDMTLNDHLGDAYWQVGRKLEARFQWTRAIGLAASEGERSALQAKMEDGLTASDHSLASVGALVPSPSSNP